MVNETNFIRLVSVISIIYEGVVVTAPVPPPVPPPVPLPIPPPVSVHVYKFLTQALKRMKQVAEFDM